MQTRRIATAVTVVPAFALLLATSSSVARPPAQGDKDSGKITLAASTVASKISYQGQLTDPASGEPLNRSINLVFQLWDDGSGGSQVGPDIVKNNVAVSNGLFTVELDVPQDAFFGQALWLEISVNGQVLTPRQGLLPVPYALSLKPGAEIIDSIRNSPVLRVENTSRDADGGYALVGKNASQNTWRPAIYGENTGASAGIYGRSDGWHATVGWQGGSDASYAGVYGYNCCDGPGVWGEARGERGLGVRGEATGISGRGLYGQAYGAEGIGVKGLSEGEDGIGVDGQGPRLGVKGSCATESGTAVMGYAYCKNGYALQALNTEGTAIFAQCGATNGYAAVLEGNVKIRSRSTGVTVVELGEGLDYAEGFHVSNKSEIVPGAVLIIDPNNPGKLTVSSKSYDRKVAGIAAGAKALGSGVRLGGSQFDHDVALAGRVYCNVDATYGEISPGDLLTTSPTPGYAMRVGNYAQAQGAILGKAMERLPQGKKGQILVLVTLQ